MLRSEAERVVRSVLAETKAEFTEEQIQALCHIITRIANQTVEEGFANWSPKGGKGGGY